MWLSSLYLMEDFVWHNLCCLKSECQNCGVNIFMTCHAEKNKHFIHVCSGSVMNWLFMVRHGLEIPTKSYSYSINRQQQRNYWII